MYVVPKFSTMLNELHTNVPTSTRWLIDLGLWVGQSRDFIFCSLLIIAITTGVLWRSQSIAHLMHYLLKYHPFINARWLQWQKIRFYRGLGLLLYGGIPLLDSLPLAGQLLQSPQLKTGLQTVIRFISEGKPLSDSLWQMQLIDDLGLRLLHAGEHSGNLVAAFEHLARFYEQQLTRWIEWLGKVLEPTLMLIVGVLIGTIVMLMYVPLFELTTGLN
jgi:general secretion pathway protein F